MVAQAEKDVEMRGAAAKRLDALLENLTEMRKADADHNERMLTLLTTLFASIPPPPARQLTRREEKARDDEDEEEDSL